MKDIFILLRIALKRPDLPQVLMLAILGFVLFKVLP